MGSSGSGTSGKVSYADYLMSIHHNMLNNTDTDLLSFSMFNLIEDSHSNSPYATATSYSGRDEIGSVSVTVASALAEILSQDVDPLDTFKTNLLATSEKVNALFDITSLQTSLTKASDKADVEYQQSVKVYDTVHTGIGFSSARILARTQLFDAKMRVVMKEHLEDISKSIVQLNSNKLDDALAIAEQQYQHLRVNKAAFSMAVEMCKLQMLNEREYFEQDQFYAKYSGHWEFERMQDGFNLLAVQMGKKMTWVPSPDMPKWMVQASWVFGDPVGTGILKRSKRFRATVMGGAQGAGSGAMIGGWVGAVVGAVVGGATSYYTYSEGEWR